MQLLLQHEEGRLHRLVLRQYNWSRILVWVLDSAGLASYLSQAMDAPHMLASPRDGLNKSMAVRDHGLALLLSVVRFCTVNEAAIRFPFVVHACVI